MFGKWNLESDEDPEDPEDMGTTLKRIYALAKMSDSCKLFQQHVTEVIFSSNPSGRRLSLAFGKNHMAQMFSLLCSFHPEGPMAEKVVQKIKLWNHRIPKEKQISDAIGKAYVCESSDVIDVKTMF